jgi:transcriptional regulator with XRE-family HTH domain
MILPNIDDFYSELGDRIKTERLKRKINQEELGSQLDLTRASIINLEKGRHRPSIYQLIMIANFFDIDYTNLIPVVTEKQKKKSKASIADLNNMVTDQQEVGKSARTAVLDFLSAIKK